MFTTVAKVFFNPYRTELVFHNSSHFQHWHLCCRCMCLRHHSLSVPQNSTPFLTWNNTSWNLITQMSPSASYDLFKYSVLSVLTATAANKMTPLHVGTSYTHNIGFYSKRNISATNQIAWAVRWLHPLWTPIRGTPPLKFPLYSIFRAKCGLKSH